MRAKYHTKGIVLQRFPLGETSASVVLLTEELGLVRARAQGIRKSGAKLAHALSTLSECNVMLVRGADGWRISGALLSTPWFLEVPQGERARAGRVVALLLRMVAGEITDARLFAVLREFFEQLRLPSEEERDLAECAAVLKTLQILGLDTEDLPTDRTAFVERINRGIAASGL